MPLHKGNYSKMEATEATVRYKAVLCLTVDLRGFQGNGSKYMEDVIKQSRTCKLEASN